MDLRKIKKLIDLLEKSKLNELEIKEGDDTIRLSRSIESPHAPAPPSHTPAVFAPAPSPVAVEGAPSDDSSGGIAVTSPMVGTFFSSSEPGSVPFVQAGSVVKPDDTLCIIEAMKTFNEVRSEISGTVAEVCKSSGDPVEYGEILFIVNPG